MRVAAYCGQDWARAMRASTGMQSVTSPPLETDGRLLHGFLAKAATGDVLAFNLHGYAGQANYYGQADRIIGPTALAVNDVIQYDWSGVIVFLEVCFSAANDPANRAIPQAFLEHGARAVIGSRTEAYGRVRGTIPLPGFDGEADRLLNLFLYSIKRGKGQKLRSVDKTLALTKRLFRLWAWPLDTEDKKTLQSFTTIRRLNNETKMV